MTPPPGLTITPDDPRAPKYWMYETSGVLAPVVERYLRRPRSMTLEDIAVMRAYLRQWIDSPAWDQNPHAPIAARLALADLRRRAKAIASVNDIHEFLAAAGREGIDPL